MLSIIIGTRPEIIKMSPLITFFDKNKVDYQVIFTGQHYNENLTSIFFDELMLPQPNVFLEIGSGKGAEQTGKALIELEKQLLKNQPELVLVEGDTNTVLAAALAATKTGIPVGHVEAGLRSYDLRMPEEHNRRLTDHLSKLLFAPTETSKRILEGENVWGNIHVTGNTVIDVCCQYVPIAEKKSEIINELEFKNFALATTHRAENVDNSAVLKNLVEIFTKCPLPVVLPIHPRTVKMLKANSLYEKLSNSKNIQLIEPLGYLDFLVLMKNCSFILSDSGGIQEEATAPTIRKKVFVLRKTTDRPEASEAGFAEVLGLNPEKVLSRINQESSWSLTQTDTPSPYGNGDASQKIYDIIFSEK
jgi:UDP-N-acetylglucosamine 2-epimerase (non-hydrolysing)